LLQSLRDPYEYYEFEENQIRPTFHFFDDGVIASVTKDNFEANGRGKLSIATHSEYAVHCQIARRESVDHAEEKTLALCWTCETESNATVKNIKSHHLRFAIPHRGRYCAQVSLYNAKNAHSHRRRILTLNIEVQEGTAERVKSLAEHWLYGFIQPSMDIPVTSALEAAREIIIQRPRHGLIPFGKPFQVEIEAPKSVSNVIVLMNGNWSKLHCDSSKQDIAKTGKKRFNDRTTMNQTPHLHMFMEFGGRFYKFASFCPEYWEMKAKVSDTVSLDAYGHAFEAGFRVLEVRKLTTGAELYISCDATTMIEVRAYHEWGDYGENFENFTVQKLAATGQDHNYMISFKFDIAKRYTALVLTKIRNGDYKYTMSYKFGRLNRKGVDMRGGRGRRGSLMDRMH